MSEPVGTRRNRWIPFVLFGSILALILADGVFTYFAVSTSPGIQTENAFEKGLRHNQVLEEAKAQAELGWSVSTTLSADQRHVEVRLLDREGASITTARLDGRMARPVGQSSSQALAFSYVGDGLYRAPVQAAPGQWDVILRVQRDSNTFQAIERVFLK